MARLPESVARLAASRGGADVEGWWHALSASARSELLQLWDGRAEQTSRTRARDGFEELPITLYGVWVDPETARENAMWTEQLIEYVNAHPEVRFHMQERKFHICRSHPAAREVGRSGAISAGFICPGRHAGCPFERALRAQAGCAIHFVAGPRIPSPATGGRQRAVDLVPHGRERLPLRKPGDD